ncbi:MAG: EamA/RhaT family transporter [Xanthomonadales bacterium]|nr:EamA/RhaT family transporter [Xanthomonadales bacterium]
MSYVLASIVCSVLVSVLLKLAPRWRIDVAQAIAWNYGVASLATWLLLKPELAPLGTTAPWPTLVALGLLLPTIFLVLALSVRYAGIVRSDAAQRLSLVLPLVAAFLLFGERLTPLKFAGCALGLVALAGVAWRSGPREDRPGCAWTWPLLVFAGFGVIDVLFKRVAAAGLPLGTALAVVFALALPIAFAIALARGTRLDGRGLAGGVSLGLLNFGNILFYLRAHRALPDSPALVFASMNLGVVALGALVGLVVFREQLGRLNLAALLLALVAIGVLVVA